LTVREDAVVEWIAQNRPDGPLFVAGVSDGALLNSLTAANVGPLCACDISGEKGANWGIKGSLNIYCGDFRQWWRRSGGEGTFSAVIALGWPAKMNQTDHSEFRPEPYRVQADRWIRYGHASGLCLAEIIGRALV